MEQALQIYLLGDFRLVVQGRFVTRAGWQKRKARMLVQILALQRSKSMRRDQLVELLFPDADAKSANENFYRAVYAARHALRPDLPAHAPSRYLIADGKQLLLADPVTVRTDVEDFERLAHEGLKKNTLEVLETAEALYGGDLLEDEPHEEWTFEPRRRLKALYHSVVRRLAAEAETRGEFVSAHKWLDKALTSEPADEAAHRAKMRLFQAQGDRSLALRQYETCAAALRRELAVEPESETEHLRQMIINHSTPDS